MAKSYYYKKRFFRKKGRWSANIQRIESQTITFGPGTDFSSITLTENPPQSSTSVSQQYTVKNIEFTYEMEADGGANLESLCAYIMYRPQGMNYNDLYPQLHPEYIMAYRFLGSPNFDQGLANGNPGRNPLRIKTRMARRLQTGDSVILLITGVNEGGSEITATINGIVRWWTKAN